MKAVGYHHCLPIDDPAALQDLDLPAPDAAALGAHDLRVAVRAVSVNPVDTKIRRNRAPDDGRPGVLGWDAVGIVEAVGTQVDGFAPGDRVWYAGSLTRPGTNAEVHLVDHRIAAHAPRSLSDAEAAALPLTAITAWELLFDRLGVPNLPDRSGAAGRTLLVVGGAGGVGSILIQLARQLTGLTVVATASRPETRDWCLALGAHAVVDHREPLAEALRGAGHPQVALVAALTETARHWPQLVEALAPQGRIALIDDPAEPPDVKLLKTKSGSLHWEFMFTRSMYGTPDIAEQGRLLVAVAQLVDDGRIRSTQGAHFGAIDAANLRRAHAFIESGRARGKVVLAGW